MSGAQEISVVALLDYLLDLDATKHPPVHDFTTENLFMLEERALPDVPGVELTPGADAWLTVEYVDLPARPTVPEHLTVVLPGQIGPHQAPEPRAVEPVVRALLDATRAGAPDAESEDEDEDTLVALRREAQSLIDEASDWVEEYWEPWASDYRDAERCKQLYRDLFTQQDVLAADRDTYELLWGFGRVRWRLPDGKVIHAPVLAAPVEIELDEQTQELRVRCDDDVDLQMSYLASLELHDRHGLLSQREALQAAAPDPWGAELEEVLRRVVRCLHDRGVLAGEGDRQAEAPVIEPGWVLFVRRRQTNYKAFVETLRELYSSGANIPEALATLVGDPTGAMLPAHSEAGDGADHGTGTADENEPLLLPLHVNEEQQQILQIAQRQPGVIVQGPPGTGKTHTIANLISHYVAYGKRVLVLAEKERALREVSGKVPAGIRDLTVSVLGSDESSRRELGSAVANIQSRVTTLDLVAQDAEIARLTAALDETDRAIAETTDAMLRARQQEVQRLNGDWPCEGEVTPQNAASWLSAHPEHAGIPDELRHDQPCPLSSADLVELIRIVTTVGPERAKASLSELPALTDLPDPATLAGWLQTITQADAQLGSVAERVRSWDSLDNATEETLAGLSGRIGALQAARNAASSGWLAAVANQLRDPLLPAEWRAFTAAITGLREQIASLRLPLLNAQVNTPAERDPQLVARLLSAREIISKRGRLGMLDRSERAAVGACQVDGRIPATVQDIGLVLTQLQVVDARTDLIARWSRQLGPLGAPQLGPQQPEVEVREPLEQLTALVNADDGWTQIRNDLNTLSIDAGMTADLIELAQLSELFTMLPTRVAQRRAQANVAELSKTLTAGAAAEGASPLWMLLHDAVAAGQPETYGTHRTTVADLHAVRGDAARLRDLHARVATPAPQWADEILHDPTRAGDPGTIQVRWQWRQLDSWVKRVIHSSNPSELQARLHQLTEARRQQVSALVTARAWRRLVGNLGAREIRGLNTYLEAIKRFGKTGGKYQARRSAEIRRSLEECQHAVPVWIMTSSRALTSFRPEQEPPFDVVIFDEASQAGYEAVPLLSLGKQAIIVGDDKQTSPENVGLQRERVFSLMDDHLRPITGYRTVFDPDGSLYDLARQRFTNLVMLVEHFRCLPDIIRFSNEKFYDRKIQPLRDRPPLPGWEPLGAVKVVDGYRSGDINRPEAEAVADLLAKLHHDPRYDGMTFGVVTLLSAGGGQAQLIHDLLLDRLTPEGFHKRKVQVGDAAAFQGAERDVIVLSLVVAPTPGVDGKRIGAINNDRGHQRINVAASRAQQQMWVVHSVEPEAFPANDLRAELIRHCRDPRNAEAIGAASLAVCDSPFEVEVITRLLERGFRRVHAQHQVGSENRNYRIDIVVEGRQARLAVECDGERWHGPDRWHADHARQRVLERAGWTFERIRGSAFYRDRDAALQPLWARLADLGITPDDGDIPVREGCLFEVRGGCWFDQHGTMVDGFDVRPEPTPAPAAPTQSHGADEEGLSAPLEQPRSPRTATTTRTGRAPAGVDPSHVREWARRNGHAVGDRGRLSATLISAYLRANAAPSPD